jgi:hypothetical protein
MAVQSSPALVEAGAQSADCRDPELTHEQRILDEPQPLCKIEPYVTTLPAADVPWAPHCVQAWQSIAIALH